MKKKQKPLTFTQRKQQVESGRAKRNRRRLGRHLPARDEVMEKFAREIRKIYTLERSDFETLKTGVHTVWKPAKRYDGKKPVVTTDGVVLDNGTQSTWLKLAKFFAESRIDPRAYIQAQFEATSHRDRALNPDQLMSQHAIYRWKKAKKRKDAEIELALKIQSSIASCEITVLQRFAQKSMHDASAIVLLNTGLDLSALFRYCLALSIGGKRFRRIARRFEADACLQFERFRTYYLRHWKSVLPEGFSERSRLVYEFLLWEPDDGKDEGEGEEDFLRDENDD